MINSTYEVKGTYIKKVTKPAALEAFNQGKQVYLTPSNFRPDSPWFSPATISRETVGSFTETINEFQYYNCINSETGRRVNYFIETNQ